MMDTARIAAMVADADAEFGRIDILVNNVGGVAKKMFADQGERSWRRHIDINFVSFLAATSAVIPVMVRVGRGGSIDGISSFEDTRAAPGYAVYEACKSASCNFST